MTAVLPPLAGIPLPEMLDMRRDLVRAMSSGALSVRYADGTSITYRNIAEMKESLDALEGRIASFLSADDASAAPIRALRVTPSSGWR